MSRGMRWAGPSRSLQVRSCTKQSDWDDFLHNESKPLALPCGRTTRLDSDVRVRNHIVRSMRVHLEESENCLFYGRSGTLVGQGFAVIVTCGRGSPSADASWSAEGLRKRLITDPRSSCCIRAVLAIRLGFNFLSLTMGTIDSMKSVLTLSALDALCEKYHIPDVVYPELPGRKDRICNSSTGKIDVYSRFFDFANYRIPLSQFLVDILAYFRINLSQLSVIAAAKVSHFEILCHIHGFVPTVEMDLFAFINHADPTKVRIGEQEVAEGEVPLLELTRGRVVPFASVNDQENVNVNDDLNERDGDAAETNQIEQGEHVVDVGGIDVVADNEVQAIVADKPQRVRKNRKAVDGASGPGLPPKNLREDHGTSSTGGNTGGIYIYI
ncbi:hypothetical protein Tco_0824866 [Tanacetum coccineum]